MKEIKFTIADLMSGARPPKGAKFVREEREFVKCPMSLIRGPVVRITKVFEVE